MTTFEPAPTAVLGSAVPDTPTLRTAAANAARCGLERQLDWRIDIELDPDGFHVVTLDDVLLDSGPEEVAVRCHALIKTRALDDPVLVEIDLRMRDYMAFPPGERHGEQSRTVRVPARALVPDAETPVGGRVAR